MTLLDKRDERIRRMFGQIAPWYDFLNHLLSLNIDQRWRARTVRMVPPRGPSPILDLCTGTGDLAFAYERAAKGSVVGADFCHEMLVRAEAKRVRRRDSHVTFLEADAQDLPFRDEQFQIVSVSFGLRNVADPDRGLREIVRVLEPGGRAAILEFSRPRGRVLGRAYTTYFRRVLPKIGQLFSRNRESAYKYLPESVMAFPDGEALCDRLRQAGLTDVTFTPMTFGVATLYIGTKPLTHG